MTMLEGNLETIAQGLPAHLRVMHLTILGEPVAKARPRVVRPIKSRKTMAFTPQSTVGHMDLIRRRYIEAYGSARFFSKDEPLQALFVFHLSRPPSAPKKRRLPVVRPDLTNYAQLVCDALSGFAYHDDSQLVDISLAKLYGQPPCTVIMVHRADTEIEEQAGDRTAMELIVPDTAGRCRGFVGGRG